MNTSDKPIVIAKVISRNVIARGDKQPYTGSIPILNIFQESGTDDGAFFPAVDITIHGKDSIENLKALCEELLKEPEVVITNKT